MSDKQRREQAALLVQTGRQALDSAGLERLLDEGLDPDTLVDGGIEERKHCRYLLQIAAKRGDVRAVRVLLRAGADPGRSTHEEELPLLLAMRRGDDALTDCVEALLVAGADPNIISSHYAARTPLVEAVKAGNERLVKLLLDHGASINVSDNYGRTLLDHAGQDDTIGIARMLLENGADPFKCFWSDDRKYVAAIINTASRADAVECLKLYLSQTRPDYFRMMHVENKAFLSVMVEKAVEYGRCDNLRYLLTYAKENNLDEGKVTTRHLVDTVNADDTSIELVRLLLEWGVDPMGEPTGHHSFNAVQSAIAREKHDVLAELLCGGVPTPVISDVLVACYMGGALKEKRGRLRPYTVEGWLVAESYSDTWQRAYRRTKSIPADARRELLEKTLNNGLDPMLRDLSGRTLLHHLCSLGAPTQDLQLLLGYVDDVNVADHDGETPLMKYLGSETQKPSKAGVSLLVNAGADIHAVDKDGRGALQVLKENKRWSDTPGVETLLLEMGAEELAGADAQRGGPAPEPGTAVSAELGAG